MATITLKTEVITPCEMQIELPAFRQDTNGNFYKIISNDCIIRVFIGQTYKSIVIANLFHCEKDIAVATAISEEEFEVAFQSALMTVTEKQAA